MLDSATVSVLLANETGHTSNPGCRAVRRGTERFLGLSGASAVGSFPLGYWSEAFAPLAAPAEGRTSRRAREFARGTTEAPELDLQRWREIRDRCLAEDPDFARRIQAVDCLVVNGEGSLHHNLPRALALLAMIDVAASLGRRVALVNATVQAMSPELMAAVLPSIGFCHVRERRSQQEIGTAAPQVAVGPDLASIAIRALPVPRRGQKALDGRTVIVSQGVLVSSDSLRGLLREVKRCGYDPVYLSIGDGGETAVATRVCADEEVALVHAGEITLEALMQLFSRAALAISGRHHINLFLLRAGIPVVSIPSNTWKIEGTFELAGYPQRELAGIGMVEEVVGAAYDERVQLSAIARDSFENYAWQAQALIGKMRSWIC